MDFEYHWHLKQEIFQWPTASQPQTGTLESSKVCDINFPAVVGSNPMIKHLRVNAETRGIRITNTEYKSVLFSMWLKVWGKKKNPNNKLLTDFTISPIWPDFRRQQVVFTHNIHCYKMLFLSMNIISDV